jgi:hypothetical protein
MEGCTAQRRTRSDRDCPLDTARDRCLWRVGGTAGENDDRSHVGGGFHLDRRVRPAFGNQRPRASRGGGAAAFRSEESRPNGFS